MSARQLWIVRVRCTATAAEFVTTAAVLAHSTGVSETVDPVSDDHRSEIGDVDAVTMLVGFGDHDRADRFATDLVDPSSVTSSDRPPIDSAIVEPVNLHSWSIDELTVVETPFGPFELEVGTAFGHGSHPTTALALDALADLPTVGDAPRRLLDVGCGTGVLALAAALAGYQTTGIDNDPSAVTIATSNADRNGMNDRIGFVCATPSELATPQWLRGSVGFDVAVANTLIGVHEAEGAAISSLLSANGTLVITGVLTDQVDRVRAAYPMRPLTVTGRDGDWVLLQTSGNSEGVVG